MSANLLENVHLKDQSGDGGENYSLLFRIREVQALNIEDMRFLDLLQSLQANV
jgi:hypothetical protein